MIIAGLQNPPLTPLATFDGILPYLVLTSTHPLSPFKQSVHQERLVHIQEDVFVVQKLEHFKRRFDL